MEIEKAEVGMNDLRISNILPTKIDEPGSKYCCATCYNVYGRVTHIALKDKVSEEHPRFTVSGRIGEIKYRNLGPRVNVHFKEVGKLARPSIKVLYQYCNHCDDTVGWKWTGQDDDYPDALFSFDTLMDRTKVILLDEEKQITSGGWDSGIQESRL